MGVALARLLDWIADFGIAPIPTDAGARKAYLLRLAGRYQEHLAKLPADLLVRCVEETMASHRFRNLPLPADMIARVSGDLARRRAALSACRLALKFNRFDAPPIALEDRVRPEQVRQLAQDLAAATEARRLAGSETPEDGEPPPPPNARQDRGEDR